MFKLLFRRKKRRNGNLGINKDFNYTHDMYDIRKVYVKFASVNHLSVHFKMPSLKNQSNAHLPNLITSPVSARHAQVPYMFNPYIPYGNFPVPPGAWGMHSDTGLNASKSEIINHTSYPQNDK